MSTKEIVYLEDIEPISPSQTATGATVSVVAEKETTIITNTSRTTAVKRQRTLMDMFSGSKDKSEPGAKRLKSASSITSNASSSRNVGPTKLNAIPFSMNDFKASLSEDEARLLKLECEVMGKSWLKILKDELKKPYFLSLKRYLWEEGVRGAEDTPTPLKVYPSPRNIYTWSNTPLGRVKVVIIGQDPYHGPGQAHGLCFSVPVGLCIPPSLKNIYAEIRAEYPEFNPPNHGNLSEWASNGVLMLNTCLTVRAKSPASHTNKGWETFTDKVVDVVDKYGGANLSGLNSDASGVGRGVVFMAWGSFAEKRVTKLNKTKHLILTSAHPSPYSANRGFFGNGHFRAANDWLEERYGPEAKVDWCRLEAEAK